MNEIIQKNILRFIDYFYPLFKNIFSKQIFRYAVCGSFTTTLDFIIFYTFYNFIFDKEYINILIWVIAPHSASFVCGFLVSFPLGFYFNRYVVFQKVNTKKRFQILKYFFVFFLNTVLNYLGLKFFVELYLWNANIVKLALTAITILISYILQRRFTFK